MGNQRQWVLTKLVEAALYTAFLLSLVERILQFINPRHLIFASARPRTRLLKPRWGYFSSLYNNLTAKEVFFLELAVKNRLWAEYRTAEFIFERVLTSGTHKPAIAIERALLFEFQGHESAKVEYLKSLLPSFVAKATSESDTAVVHLMEIMIADGEVDAFGSLRSSLEAARKLQAWLNNVPVVKYSDVMVQCALYYHSIVKTCSAYSNFAVKGIDGNLPSTEIGSSKASLTILRRTIQGQGKMLIARQLVKPEAGLYDDDESDIPYREFLNENGWPDTNDQATIYAIACTKAFFADKLAGTGKASQASNEICSLSSDLLRLTKKSIDSFNPRLGLLVAITQAEVDKSPDDTSYCEKQMQLAERAAKLDDFPIQRLRLLAAFQATQRMIDSIVDEEEEMLVAQEKQEEIILRWFSTELDSNVSASRSAACLVNISDRLVWGGTAAECLEIYEWFCAQFPAYGMPVVGWRLAAAAVRASKEIGDEEAALSHERRRKALLAQLPKIRPSPDGNVAFPVDEGEDFMSEWSLEGLVYSNLYDDVYQPVASRVILRWVKREASDARISKETAQSLLKWRPEDGCFSQWAQGLNADDLRWRIFGRESPITSEEWDLWLSYVEHWLKSASPPPSNLHRQNLLLQLCKCREHWTTANASDVTSLQKLQRKFYEQKKIAEVVSFSDSRVAGSNDKRQCIWNLAEQKILLGLNSEARNQKLVTDNDLANSQETFLHLSRIHRARRNPQFSYMSMVGAARVAYVRWLFFNKSVPLHVSLNYLLEAERIYLSVRRQHYLLSEFRNFKANCSLAENYDQRQLCYDGMKRSMLGFVAWFEQNPAALLSEAGVTITPELEEVMTAMICWMQKVKARALTGVISGQMEVPASVTEEARKHPSALVLISQEENLLAEWNICTKTSRLLKIREEWRMLQQKMGQEEALIDVQAIREGAAISPEGVVGLGHQLRQWSGNDVFFVEWLYVDLTAITDLAMALFHNGRLVNVFKLSITLSEVNEWVSRYLDPKPFEDADRFAPLRDLYASDWLHKLDSLLEPLEKFTTPGAILVFCPTQSLHRVPLHALAIDGAPIILRNPIVYCHSLTLLRYCILMSESRGTVSEDFVSVVFKPARFAAEGIETVATILGTHVVEPFTGESPKEKLKDCAKHASLFHFHGHVQFDEKDPLKHHLELSRPRYDEEGHPLPLSDEEILTTLDVFGFELQKGAHITTISCKSGRASINENDDLLGLVPSFHAAGAASMISTLWNIQNKVGARFSKIFYEDFFRQREMISNGDAGMNNMVNMAESMQKAVIEIMKDESGNPLAPYWWAALVFNGLWLY